MDRRPTTGAQSNTFVLVRMALSTFRHALSAPSNAGLWWFVSMTNTSPSKRRLAPERRGAGSPNDGAWENRWMIWPPSICPYPVVLRETMSRMTASVATWQIRRRYFGPRAVYDFDAMVVYSARWSSVLR